jgi:hypothetical protein
VVGRCEKLLARARRASGSLAFRELCYLAECLGYQLVRQRGSHRIYVHPGGRNLLSLQEDGGMAKAYQVRQLLSQAFPPDEESP